MTYRYKDKTIYYTLEGEGRPILLLHGFLESSSMWNALLKKLSKDFKVLAIDLPGHGKSQVIDEIHSMELMAEVVHALVDTLKLEAPTILGHSMGGYVALAYVENHPKDVGNLILLNSTAKRDTPERIKNRDRALELIEKERIGFIDSAIPQLFSEESRKDYQKDINRLIAEARSFPKLGIMANIRGMRDRKDRTEVLRLFDKSKMLICGEKDPIVPIDHSKKLAATTNTPIEILPGSHMSWLENPGEIVKIVHFIEFFGI